MSQPDAITRRQWLSTTSVIGTAAAAGLTTGQACAADERSHETRERAGPLAQDYVIVGRGRPPTVLVDEPCLTRLPGGGLLATYVTWALKGEMRYGAAGRFNLVRSDDDGKTWRRLRTLDICTGRPFVHDGALYVIGNHFGRRDIIISRSADEGGSWHPFVTLFEGSFWNSPSGYAIANGRFYRAFDSGDQNYEFGAGGRPCTAVAGDMSRDLLDPKSWRISNTAAYPGTPPELQRAIYPPDTFSPDRKLLHRDHWLEPNVVYVNGRLMALLRIRMANYATCSMAGVCDLVDDGRRLRLDFAQFYPIPGAQNNFSIIFDEQSGLFWMLSNLVTDSQNLLGRGQSLWTRGFTSGLGNERRMLMLFYSMDSLNWFQAGCVAMSTDPMQAFNYATSLVEGDDLLIISKTSKNGRNQHDADLITFHRLRHFRSLALDLVPKAAGA